MIGPVMFLGILAILDVLDHRVDVSGHEIGRYGIVQHVNFLFFGLLLAGFIAALRGYVRSGKLAWAGTILLGILSLGPLLATFTLDPGNGPPSTWHGTLHFVGFVLIALIPIPACFVYAQLFRQDPRWRWYSWYSLVTGILVTAVTFAPATSSGNAYAIWTGPASMLDLVLAFAWLELLAVRLWQLTTEAGSDDGTSGTRATKAAIVIGEL
jgi:drug/metabolite transporter superfamily protein YnfA